MILSYCTDSLGHLPYEAMLDRAKELGIDWVEMTTGGWSPAPHIRIDDLLESGARLKAFAKALADRGMGIAALNCSGNPLDPGKLGKEHAAVTDKTFELARRLGVKKVVMMSGLPAGGPNDLVPNWITSSVTQPADLQDVLDWQWNSIAIPYWKKLVSHARNCGVEKIALENFSSQLVWSPKTLFKLREAVDPMIGLNLDPSHMFWMGIDPIAAARALGSAIHHVHGKDARFERGIFEVQGYIETAAFSETRTRAWNYVAVGCGHDLQWWKEFFSVIKMTGYDGFVSLEMEDLTMSVEAGIRSSVDALQATLSR